MYIEGINPSRVFTANELPPAVNAPQGFDGGYGEALALGTRGRDQTGNSYILLQSPAAIATQGNIGHWNENFLFDLVATDDDIGGTPLAGNFGLPTAAGQRFWAVVEGMAPARALLAVVENARVNTTATPGAVDDDATIGAFAIEGLHFMVAATGLGSFQARYSNPHLAFTAIEAIE